MPDPPSGLVREAGVKGIPRLDGEHRRAPMEGHGELVEEPDLAPTIGTAPAISGRSPRQCTRRPPRRSLAHAVKFNLSERDLDDLAADAHEDAIVHGRQIDAGEVGKPVGGEDVLGAGVDQRSAGLHEGERPPAPATGLGRVAVPPGKRVGHAA